MFRRRELPVYMFTGMLEAGKTSFIRDTLAGGEFEDGQKTLLILCEEGVEEIPEALLKRNLVTVVSCEREDITDEGLTKLEKKYKPNRIMFENNGMWKPSEIANEFPENWMLVQSIALVDGSTFRVYTANGDMKSLIMEQVRDSDLIVFNRVNDGEDRGSFRRSVKVLNRKAQILFEDENGELDDTFADTMPFDISGDVIKIPDDDFGLWYLDTMDHPERYNGKTVIFNAMVYRHKSFSANKLVPGRFAMTCCAADIQFIGFVCYADNADKFNQKDWVEVEARVDIEYCKDYKGEGPVLKCLKPLTATQPGDQMVYFT